MKAEFQKHLESEKVPGSGKANSYVAALDYLTKMIEAKPLGVEDCKDIWSVRSIKRLSELYDVANEQKHLGRSSVWMIKGLPPSYLLSGYCTAAIRAYQEFLIQHSYEENLWEKYQTFKGNASDLSKNLDKRLSIPQRLVETWNGEEGKETLRTIRARFNQRVFRRYTLDNFRQTCCITGNPIPALLTASHIKPWRKSTNKEQLNPANGLCLAKTQDAAFDKGLITLDEDLRVVLSKSIRDYTSLRTIKENFSKYEGKAITLPHRYKPDPVFIDYHREVVFRS